jgi:rhamnosyl/mannosyltransferase
MKVLHLGKFDAFGGIERHVRALLQGLVTSGQVLPVNLVLNSNATTDEHHDHGYRTIRVANYGQLASVGIAPSLPSIARRLHGEYQFDIVHLHFPDPLGHLTAALLPRSVARVVSWHSDIVRQKGALTLYRPFQRRFLNRVDALIAATPVHLSRSNQIPDELVQRQFVIPYGFEADRWLLGPSAQARLAALRSEAADRFAIFTLGRHVYYKGFEVLIRAMRLVDGILWIGGDGPLRADLERIARSEGVSDRVRFQGPISEAELPAFYAACDAFCLPSVERSEAFGLVQLEAMHFERPVVSTRLGTGVDWVNQNDITGITVQPGDVTELAEALRRLAADPVLRKRLGEAGRRRVQSDFSAKNMVEQTIAVYRQVLEWREQRGAAGVALHDKSSELS